jgi:maltose alpha-D-glucosyltransferase/alpha-amylase
MLQIGRRLAELHLALAAHPELPDFAPEPLRRGDVEHWIADATARADRVFDALKQRRDGLKEADQALVDQLLAYRATLRERLTALPADIGGLGIRHHGDFKLGETLLVKDDIFIIDVEGNPGQPLEERRRRMPAVYDVASLIHSIDYSVTSALDRARKAGVEDFSRLVAALSDWRIGAKTAFLAGYDEAMTDRRLWPTDLQAERELLTFFLLGKAIAEIEYELARRPEGLRVTLSTALLLLSEPANETS